MGQRTHTLASFATILFAFASSAQADTYHDQYLFKYRIKSAVSANCLEIPKGKHADGINIQETSCDSDENQRWMFRPREYGGDKLGTHFNIVSQESDKCMRALTAGANIQQWTCAKEGESDFPKQLWQSQVEGGEIELPLSYWSPTTIFPPISPPTPPSGTGTVTIVPSVKVHVSLPGYKLLSTDSGKCLDSASGQIQVQQCTMAQRWLLDDPQPWAADLKVEKVEVGSCDVYGNFTKKQESEVGDILGLRTLISNSGQIDVSNNEYYYEMTVSKGAVTKAMNGRFPGKPLPAGMQPIVDEHCVEFFDKKGNAGKLKLELGWYDVLIRIMLPDEYWRENNRNNDYKIEFEAIPKKK